MNGLTHSIEAAQLTRPTDDVSQTSVLEVKMGSTWVLVESDIFDSWTGLRKINGEDYHGPVSYLEGGVYRGARVCGCDVCQSETDPKHKKN